MKKLIDIPDSIVKDLKILAVKNDKDLKNYIQDLILRKYEECIIQETNVLEKKANKHLDPLREEFIMLGHEKTKFKFKCYTDKGFVYDLEEKEGSVHEIFVISENTDFFDKMTINEILSTTPFYINHRYFYYNGEEKKCDDLFEFRIVDTPEYIEKFSV